MLSDWRKRIPRPLGKGGVGCSIHPGGTIKSRSFLGFPTNRAQREMTRGDANAPGTSRKNGADLGQRFTACSAALLLALAPLPAAARSEEHTSELQSLMRNSYAVFCLKKNKN